MKNNIFIKSLLISFSIHLFGVSLFSIFLPPLPKKNKPIEVLIYNNLGTKSKDIEKNLIVKKIEKDLGKEKITTLNKAKSENIAPEITIGEERKYEVQAKLDLDIEKYEFKINLPPSSTSEEQKRKEDETLIIDGPIGERKIIYKEKIEYPLWAQKKGIEGKVKIKFWVNPEGKIFSTEIYTSSGFPEIDFYAEENFQKWLFEPIITDKEVWGIITFIFKLK